MARIMGGEIILGPNHVGKQVTNTSKWSPTLGDEIFPKCPKFLRHVFMKQTLSNWVLSKLLERFWRIDLILDNTINKPLLSLWWFFILEIFLKYFGIFFKILKIWLCLYFKNFKKIYKSFYDFKTLVIIFWKTDFSYL